MKIKIALLAILLIGTQAQASDTNGWTDTELCIWSYDGLIDYDLAVEGCKSRRLQGLSSEEQAAIWELPDQEIKIIAERIKEQATQK